VRRMENKKSHPKWIAIKIFIEKYWITIAVSAVTTILFRGAINLLEG